ncbi:GDSL esterase/lipase At5g45670-like [Impatiens glandulifera]|uniref:GDSL esterase/lipase At5g45670-like n=1 Tax=Impatiens glandulifera TaxID=253017 RepID=UPI001FB090B5|nr:GDSL esterase/lipase At5g45670-like [Impatiens glandulifera]
MTEVNSEPQVPCYFVFGDSLVDNGNNNNLKTSAKVNYPPYGVDFPQGPTGRFCNGPNFADIIAQLLGFDRYIPPFTNTTGYDILLGVNYGSGGGGILDESGKQLVRTRNDL